jgi:signal transduction histidine kinase
MNYKTISFSFMIAIMLLGLLFVNIYYNEDIIIRYIEFTIIVTIPIILFHLLIKQRYADKYQVFFINIFDYLKDPAILIDLNTFNIIKMNDLFIKDFYLDAENILGKELGSLPFINQNIINKIKNNKNPRALLESSIQISDGKIKYYIDIGRFEFEKNSYLLMVFIRENPACLDLDEFISIVTHDLKSPFKNIRSISKIIATLLEDTEIDIGKIFAHLNRIVNISDSSILLIEDFNEYGKLKLDIDKVELCDLDEFFEQMRHNFSDRLDYEIEFEYNNLPVLLMNPLKLEELLSNLIENSINFRKADEKLKISIKYEFIKNMGTEFHTIAIKDNGIGFDNRLAERIFYPFKKLNKNKKGTGLGLTICKKIMALYNGKILASGIPGVGATFTLIFPKNVIYSTKETPKKNIKK